MESLEDKVLSSGCAFGKQRSANNQCPSLGGRGRERLGNVCKGSLRPGRRGFLLLLLFLIITAIKVVSAGSLGRCSHRRAGEKRRGSEAPAALRRPDLPVRMGLSFPEQRGAPSLPPHLTSPRVNFLKSPFPGSRLPDVELFPGASHPPERLPGGSAAPQSPQPGARGSRGAPREARLRAESRQCPPGVQALRAFAWVTCPVLRDPLAPAGGDGVGGRQRNKEKLKMTGGSKGRGCG